MSDSLTYFILKTLVEPFLSVEVSGFGLSGWRGEQ